MSFSEKLENYTSDFYKKLAEKFHNEKHLFLAFVEESKKNNTILMRTYRETISDALEACFAFETLQIKKYEVKKIDIEKMTYNNALKAAVKLENQASGFYYEIAERSRSLLATISTAFKKIAKKRREREEKIRSLIS
jgi:rubrerythrin